jgi:hypothetical protein
MEAVKHERAAHFYQFGNFKVDPAKCVLLRNGEIVPLSVKSFEMPLVWSNTRGEALEKNIGLANRRKNENHHRQR